MENSITKLHIRPSLPLLQTWPVSIPKLFMQRWKPLNARVCVIVECWVCSCVCVFVCVCAHMFRHLMALVYYSESISRWLHLITLQSIKVSPVSQVGRWLGSCSWLCKLAHTHLCSHTHTHTHTHILWSFPFDGARTFVGIENQHAARHAITEGLKMIISHLLPNDKMSILCVSQ